MLGTKNVLLLCVTLFSFYLNVNFVSCDLIQYNELILEDANLLVVSLGAYRITFQLNFSSTFSQI